MVLHDQRIGGLDLDVRLHDARLRVAASSVAATLDAHVFVRRVALAPPGGAAGARGVAGFPVARAAGRCTRPAVRAILAAVQFDVDHLVGEHSHRARPPCVLSLDDFDEGAHPQRRGSELDLIVSDDCAGD